MKSVTTIRTTVMIVIDGKNEDNHHYLYYNHNVQKKEKRSPKGTQSERQFVERKNRPEIGKENNPRRIVS